MQKTGQTDCAKRAIFILISKGENKMKWFHNMKTKTKMLLSFFVVIALMMALSIFAVLEMGAVNELSTFVTNYADQRERKMLELRTSVLDLRRVIASMTMYVPLNDVGRIHPLIAEADTYYESCFEVLDRYDDLVKSDPYFTKEEKTERLGKTTDIRKALDRYKNEVFETIADSALKGDYRSSVEAATTASGVVAGMWRDITQLFEYATETSDKGSQAVTELASNSERLIVIVAIIVAVIGTIIALYVASLISRPLVKLSAFMKKAGVTGNLALSTEEEDFMNKFARNNDEIGSTISGAASFIDHVTKIDHEMKAIANGDLTGEIILKSDEDTMGLSLKKMMDNLNSMFGEINSTTHKVTNGTRQITDGAQALALGATEQVASIEELSESISEIAKKTEENARTAEKASELSSEIKENAERGSHHMDDMIMAVKDISDASKTINKIIHTIDDIAFQTNILALNAAVEAARAGQHGKGFAVVAEEVRSLASKSAEAAKDTGNMIQDSIVKTQLGSQIAGETAASLNEIVLGINESARLIDEITHASEQQSLKVKQIKDGMDQVAHVVQQNSATAEESAAASEKMNGEYDILEHLIAQFRLKGSGSVHHHANAHERSRHSVLDVQDNTDFTIDSEQW